jgi:hypothetical protein
MSPNISQIISPNPLQQSLRESGINLKDGQIIRATVLKTLPDSGTLISVNGKQLNIPAALNLPEGSRLMLQVTLTGSKIELRPVENPSQRPEIPAQSISPATAKESLTGVISELKAVLDQKELNNIAAQGAKDLKQIMPSLLYSDPGKTGGAWIKENLLAGGMLWENKVAEFLSDENNSSIKKLMKGDLKAILLSLRKEIETEGGGGHDSTAALKVKQALALIENLQIQNLASLEDRLGLLFCIPGLAKDGLNSAEVFVKKRRGSDNGISFSVQAEFSRLGRFDADISMMNSMTSIRILTDDKEKADIVNDNLSILESGIKALGFNNVALSCNARKASDLSGMAAGVFAGRSKAIDMVI